MFKKTITYFDFDDNERTESYYFHMNKAEAYDWLLGLPAETRAKMQATVERQDTSLSEADVLAMMHYIRDLILTSVGEKSEDGRRFIKTECERKPALAPRAAHLGRVCRLCANAIHGANE